MKETIHIDKPWGYEKHIEINENYVVKELFMKEGCGCSLQFHNNKHETFYVVSGKLRFYVGNNKDNLQIMYLETGSYYIIKPMVVHRMEAVVDSKYIECSTNFLDDVVRIDDKYGRI